MAQGWQRPPPVKLLDENGNVSLPWLSWFQAVSNQIAEIIQTIAPAPPPPPP